jgi:hypothetical protein
VTLTEGTRAITAKATDTAGNVSLASAALTITVDTTVAAPKGFDPAAIPTLSNIVNGIGGFVINGAAADDRAGTSARSAGDVNNDGLDDLIVGANLADPNGTDSGASYVVFGKAGGTAVNLSALGTGGFVINGAAAGDQSGRSVSSAGDVNNDGLDDLIVGAHLADPNGTSSGASYVVFGKNDNTPVDLSALGNGGFVINGATAGDYSGRSVSSAGDVNGDGLDDLIVGAPYVDPNGSNSGASYVVFGKANTTPVNLSALGTGGFVINGAAAGDFSGWSVSSAGDVNGDGLDDLIVGAHYADPTATTTNAGASYVVFGKNNNTPVNLSALGTGGFVINGAAAGDLSGTSVRSAGDVNGDGLADLIVGANRADPNGSDSGASYVVFGKADNTAVNLSAIASGIGGFVINGAAANDLSGVRVGSAGDVNGDGLDDLIVGALYADPNGSNSGASYVVYGKANTTPVNLSALGTGGFVINGQFSGDQSGVSVSSAGDVNNDGFDDLIVGANRADRNGIDSGASYVVFGGNFTGTGATLDLATVDDTGSNDRDNLTSKTSGLTFTGVAEAGATVELFNGTTSLGTTTASATGAFSLDVTLTEGTRSITAKATDTAGNLSAPSAALTIRVDTTPPAAPTGLDLAAVDDTGSSNTDNITSQTSGLTISGTAEANARVELFNGTTLLGATTANATTGAFSLDVTLTEGTRSITAKATDTAGNVSLASAALVITVTQVNQADILNGTGGFVIVAAAAGDASGVSVSSAGDVNNDGFDDDMLIVGDANFLGVDGGAGTDTLRMAGTSGFGLDLPTLAPGAIKDIEVIDLVAGELNNILTVTQQTLMNLSTTTNRLMVLGGSGDTVNANGFNLFDAQTENGIAYILYGNGSAELWVQSGVAVVTTAPLSSGFFSTGFDGNDMLIVGDANFLGVDGGAGTDTLRMAGTSGFTLDLPTLAPGAIKDIEVIDLVAGELNNILTVTQQTLLDLSTTSDRLTVLGDSGDTVNANGFSAGGAAQTVDGITYNVYNNGSAELWVQQGVVVDGIVPPPAGFVAPAISWTDQAVLGI